MGFFGGRGGGVCLFNPNQLFATEIPKQRQPARVSRDSGGGLPGWLRTRALAPRTGSRKAHAPLGSPLSRPAAPHPRLTSFSQASRGEHPEWVGTHSSNNSPASPTHQPAKFPRREGWVSGFRGLRPLSQALELRGSHASDHTGSALQGDPHGDSSLVSDRGSGSVPCPCPS